MPKIPHSLSITLKGKARISLMAFGAPRERASCFLLHCIPYHVHSSPMLTPHKLHQPAHSSFSMPSIFLSHNICSRLEHSSSSYVMTSPCLFHLNQNTTSSEMATVLVQVLPKAQPKKRLEFKWFGRDSIPGKEVRDEVEKSKSRYIMISDQCCR